MNYDLEANIKYIERIFDLSLQGQAVDFNNWTQEERKFLGQYTVASMYAKSHIYEYMDWKVLVPLDFKIERPVDMLFCLKKSVEKINQIGLDNILDQLDKKSQIKSSNQRKN